MADLHEGTFFEGISPLRDSLIENFLQGNVPSKNPISFIFSPL